MRPFLAALCFSLLLAAAPAAHAAQHADAPGEPAAAEHAEHGAHGVHAGHHVPTFDDINWFYGWFGEREGVEPSVAFRPKGMPAPFGIWILDALILYGFIFKVAKKPVGDALKNRKANILRGMDEAARMKRDAERRLEEYEAKLERIEEEVERVRHEMREGAEAERVKILADAHARRERMEKDAHLLVEQELVAARDALKGEMIVAAMKSAAVAVKERLRPEDQQRLADEYLAGLGKAGSSLRGRA
jgi:F-type H+-transporting ATPase subunit b